jgi:hypothetical protein
MQACVSQLGPLSAVPASVLGPSTQQYDSQLAWYSQTYESMQSVVD